MPATRPRRSIEERARLGETAFDRHVKPLLRPDHDGLFVAVDIDTGEYEIDKSDLAAISRLEDRVPGAEIWLMRAGHPTAYKFAGAR